MVRLLTSKLRRHRWNVLIAFLLGTVASGFAQSVAFDADVRAVAVDPRNPSRIYASAREGLLKTDNRGTTWEQLPIFPLGRRQPVLEEIEFDLNNTSVIYALAYGSSSDRLVGAWRSSNRGISWQRVVEPATFPQSSQLIRILVAPTNGSVLYAVLRIGAAEFTYRSADGGATWASAGEGGASSVSTGNPDTLYRSAGTAFFRSTDGGRSWLQTAQLPNNSNPLNRITSIAASPSDPNVLLAGISGPSSSVVGVYRSTNGGGNWSLVQGGGTANSFKFNVRNPSLVLVASGDGTLYSNDGGLSFVRNSQTLEGFSRTIETQSASFDYSQMGALIVRLSPSRGGGGVAVQNGPSGVFRKLAGTYTPTAVAEVFLESGQMLSGDTSEGRSVVSIVAAEGGSAAGFVIGNPASVGPGTSARITSIPPVGNNATQRVVVSRSAQNLNAGTYNTTVSLPVTGALNRELTIEGTMEVVDQPQDAGVSLGINLPRDFTESISSIATANGKIYLGTFTRLVALDGKGQLEVIAGTGTAGFSGDGGPATRAQVREVTQIVVARDGTVHFYDRFNGRIRRVATNGTISTLSGNPSGTSTITEGALLNSINFSQSPRLAARANGELLVAHSLRIWRIDGNSFRSIAGGGAGGGPQDGSLATAASFSTGGLVTVDPQNAILFSDRGRLFRILPSNTLQWLAGAEANRDVLGSRNAREVALSIEAIVSGADGVYLFDGLTETIKRVNPDATIETVALNGMIGPASGCTGALFAPRDFTSSPGLAIAPDASLLFVDSSLKRFWIPRGATTQAVRPVVTPEGVVNAASLSRALSPGTLASIFGLNLAAGQAAASSLPLPAELAGGVACMAGRVAPIAFASPSQLNVQIPFGLVPGTHSLRAFNAAGGTGAVAVNLQAASPEIFRANGRAIVINPDGSLNQTNRGVAAGQVIVAYLTGIGEVAPALETGSASPSNPLALPAGATSATVGGMNAPLLFLGMSPGFVGLAQANVQIPALAAGEHDLVLRVGSQASEALAITVQ
jgi:uncharacterized protein (TIGR03437 family)